MAAPRLAPDIACDRQPPLIALLRFAALECRTAPRADLPPGEAMRDAAVEEMAVLLARMLPTLLQRRPVIRRPGAADLSFDESWLLALARALSGGDAASARFLLARRARPEGAAVLRMLVGDLAARLDFS
ncbi:hypothetical protein [Jannaschia seohaensis]|uniref:Uncharacterized protein n=1 Tax=Jannaschia seohaensis TaxID=475081 RepID=A0A2Y9A2J4_9RHOB|nr:hypothetical protein [Jannaschia seohaensis]PWJ22392.1 hypothetical protein BCF38_101804 [Jannaschia seohaensis]SSA38670.1 hypothetical protein SAMN05421539_101804 [Jannaschia seohaensis]